MSVRILGPGFAGAVLLAFAAPAGATDFYVSPSGSGSACSQAQPCREIRDALALYPASLGPGDRILVADGSYLGFDVDGIDGAPGQPITIQAQGTGAVVTVTVDRPDNRDTIFVTFSSWIVVDGLRAFGANRAGVRVDQSPNVTVKNGMFGLNTTWGIFTDFADDLLIENNECYGSNDEHGIYVSNSGDRPVVRGNRLHHNAGAGVQLNADLSAGGDGVITDALIENNVIYENGSAGGAGINLDGVQDSVVRNNLLYDNHATGIVNYMGDGAEGPTGMQIYHNTVVQAQDGRWALLFGGTVGPNTVRNNILYHPDPNKGGLLYADPSDVPNVDSDYNVLDRITPDDEGTLYTLAQWQQAFNRELNSRVAGPLNALFVDAVFHDYHLPQGSPAVDNGQTLARVPLDIEGTPRPQGPASDVGSYERPAAVVPALTIGDVTQLEGNVGTTSYAFTVLLSAPSPNVVTVDYATADGTATAPGDYQAAAGTLSFAPGAASAGVVVAVVGDALAEPDESFTVNLTGATGGATIADAQAAGVILNDDVAAGAEGELVHGSQQVADLRAQPGPVADVDFYRISQKPHASYEVVVDAISGDLGSPANPIQLTRVAGDLTTVLQSAGPAGVGGSRSLRWRNDLATTQETEAVSVASGGCTLTCDPADTYRIRAWETTVTLARLNNSGTQVTVLVLRNNGDTPVDASVWYWWSYGAVANSQTLTIATNATTTINTAAVVPGTFGTITVSHNGRYGQLTGKAVAVEPATGFTFDTELRSRPR